MTPCLQEREPEGQHSLKVHDWLNWRYWAHVSSSVHTIWKGFIVEWRSPCCSVSSPCSTSSTCTAKRQNIFLILSFLRPYDFTLSCLSHRNARSVCSIYKQNTEKNPLSYHIKFKSKLNATLHRYHPTIREEISVQKYGIPFHIKRRKYGYEQRRRWTEAVDSLIMTSGVTPITQHLAEPPRGVCLMFSLPYRIRTTSWKQSSNTASMERHGESPPSHMSYWKQSDGNHKCFSRRAGRQGLAIETALLPWCMQNYLNKGCWLKMWTLCNITHPGLGKKTVVNKIFH